jgi:hypothetical protein
MHPGGLAAPPMYRRDSRLLVYDPTGVVTDSLDRPYFASVVEYFEWDGKRLVPRDSVDAGGWRILVTK